MLMNTSFNTKGKPIVNRAATALRMLREEPDLDYVLIDDWLFANKKATRKNWMSSYRRRKARGGPRSKPRAPPPKKKDDADAKPAGGSGARQSEDGESGGFVNLGTMLGQISGRGGFGGRIKGK